MSFRNSEYNFEVISGRKEEEDEENSVKMSGLFIPDYTPLILFIVKRPYGCQ